MTGTIDGILAAIRYYDSLNLGYDQSNRWDLRKNGEADCSSVCGAIADRAGYPVNLSGTFYTGNFAQRFKEAGFQIIRWGATDVRPGDFIVSPGSHVEVAYSTTRWFSARNDERGRATGGKAGNQGDNVGFGKPYDMSKRGTRTTWICRPPDAELRQGDRGMLVEQLQRELLKTPHGKYVAAAGGADGDFGAGTAKAVKALQAAAGIKTDQVVGKDTRKALAAAVLDATQPAPPDPVAPTEPEVDPAPEPDVGVPPAPVPVPPKPTPAKTAELQLGVANCQSYDGTKTEAAWRARARIMASKGWTVIAVCETSKAGRTVILDELCKQTGHRWRQETLADKSVAVLWDDTVWANSSRRTVSFGTAFGHGAICAPLKHRKTGLGVDVISTHTRPKSVATSAQKASDVAKAAGLRKGWPVVLAGDFAMSKPNLPGWIRATPNVDSMDQAGDQRVDAAFIRGAIGAGKGTVVDPGPLSDHKWLGVTLTLGGSPL